MTSFPIDMKGVAIIFAVCLVWFGKLLVDKIFPSQEARIKKLEENQVSMQKEIREWQAKYFQAEHELTVLQGKYDLLKYELNQVRATQNQVWVDNGKNR